MSDRLRAVVIGAGWAGEGHTKALQWCGVDVVAICARQEAVVQQVAERLGVAVGSADWRAVLKRVRPDIVSIATPAVLRREIVEVAAVLGSHLVCEKPLAVNATEAADTFRLADAAGIKHAYAATHRYDPSVVWLAELVQEGTVGPLTELVGTFRSNLPPVLPYSWALEAQAGGGLLNN